MSDQQKPAGGRILWGNVATVVSAGVLIATEVFGAAFATGWALGSLFELGELGADILQGAFFVIGIVVMIGFIRGARRVEPFTAPR